MDLSNFIQEKLLIIVLVLYVIGAMLKGISIIKDNWIPFILLIISIYFCIAINGFNVESIIQGILITGATVLTNQMIKQGFEKGDIEL